MKKLMIISLLLITSIGYSNLQAQSISSLRSKVERLERKIEKQNEKIEEEKGKVEEAQKKVQDKIEEEKKKAKDNPHAHGSNSELDELREDLKKAQKQLEKEQEKLEELKEDLEKAKSNLEEKLNNAVDDIIKKNPIPDDPEKLDEYEKKMKKLETNPRNAETERELRKRIQKRIDAKRKEMEEHGSLPGHQNRDFSTDESNWKRIHDDNLRRQLNYATWAARVEYTTWFTENEKYSDDYFDELTKQIYNNDELFESLMEKIGGEFFIGSFTEPPSFTDYEFKNPKFLGINGAYYLSEHFGIEAGFAKGWSSVSANFPVTVIDFENGSTGTSSIFGKLTNSRDLYSTYANAQYLMFAGAMRAVIGAGMGFQRDSASTIDAIMGGERFTIQTIDPQSRIFFQAGAGIQLKFSKRIFLDVTLKARQLEKKTELGAGLGIQFGLTK